MNLRFEAATFFGSSVGACEAPVEQSNATEHDLVRQLQAGNKMAYRKFVEEYQSDVYRVAYKILGNREEADEIAQKVFTKVYFSVKSFDGRRSLYTWIFGIAINECYGFLGTKRLKLRNEGNSARNVTSIRVHMRDSCTASERVVEQRELLNRLLERMPEEDRRLLLLRELECYSVAKLSEITGLNESAIKVRLFRTRQQLVRAATQLVSG